MTKEIPSPSLKKKSRDLRKSLTGPEKKLWHDLRNRQCGGHKFRRQYVIRDFIVDFVCLERKLVVELDGNSHNDNSEFDAKRQRVIEAAGFRVIRFDNDEVLQDSDAVLETILAECQSTQ